MSLLITLLIFAVVAYVAFWIIGQIALPDPMGLILRIIVGVSLLLVLLSKAGIPLNFF